MYLVYGLLLKVLLDVFIDLEFLLLLSWGSLALSLRLIPASLCLLPFGLDGRPLFKRAQYLDFIYLFNMLLEIQLHFNFYFFCVVVFKIDWRPARAQLSQDWCEILQTGPLFILLAWAKIIFTWPCTHYFWQTLSRILEISQPTISILRF